MARSLFENVSLLTLISGLQHKDSMHKAADGVFLDPRNGRLVTASLTSEGVPVVTLAGSANPHVAARAFAYHGGLRAWYLCGLFVLRLLSFITSRVEVGDAQDAVRSGSTLVPLASAAVHAAFASVDVSGPLVGSNPLAEVQDSVAGGRLISPHARAALLNLLPRSVQVCLLFYIIFCRRFNFCAVGRPGAPRVSSSCSVQLR